MDKNKILTIKNLTKKFGEFKAVNDLSLNVYTGDIYGFLGPNGAGKSTTLRTILGLINPTEGQISFNNQLIKGSDRSYLNHIGSLIERPDFYKNLSAYDNLLILFKMSKMKNKNRIDEVLNEVGLLNKKNNKVGGFSQGMKQRLGIAQAILHHPKLIILDEPSNGLDPQGQSDMRDLIMRINQEFSITIIISSHILSEIEKISNRMIVINNGKKIVEGNVQDLMQSETMKVRFKTKNKKELINYFETNKIEYICDDDFIISHMQELDIEPTIIDLTTNNIHLMEVRQLRTLEELFLKWTK
ncbi:MAG: bacitracin ABC transporter ATP-binding protein [Crocinitomicaceae bacterium]|nr:bacitracin ABC transporter ATP-binding protein [Crocinitomicaceae bacterium]|tara:strand:+ start:4050 stop:4949 length:900 start_codon:yes stop_codon:yes gene_type:complete